MAGQGLSPGWVASRRSCIIAFYAVTDHIAGIGNGVVMQRSGASSISERPEIDWLFDVANDVGGPGAWALALAAHRDGDRHCSSGWATEPSLARCCSSCRACTSRSQAFTSTGPAGSSPWSQWQSPSVGPPRDNHRCERHLLGFEPLALDGLAKAQATPRSCPRHPYFI